MKTFHLSILLFVFCSTFSQQNVIYNGKSFKKSEVVKAAIGNSGETMSFVIEEHDLSPNGKWAQQVRKWEAMGKEVDNSQAPRGLSLIIDIDFKRRFPFPIKPTDSVFVNYSSLQMSFDENSFQTNQMKKVDETSTKNEQKSFQQQKVNIEVEARRITKLMQQGKISPDEAMKKIEALANPLLNKIDNSKNVNPKFDEFNEPKNYSINFGNSNINEGMEVVTGTLHIISFTEDKLIATFRGTHKVECIDTKRLNDKNSPCKKVAFSLEPRIKILREEPVTINIDCTFNKFEDFRN